MSERNPFAAPHASLIPPVAADDGSIAALAVSATWKLRFRLIQQAGGISLPQIGALRPGQRMRIHVNLFAFLFGPLYYLCKGMWRKAISMFAVSVLIGMVIGAVADPERVEALARVGGVLFGLYAMGRVNRDYYRKVVLKDNGWF